MVHLAVLPINRRRAFGRSFQSRCSDDTSSVTPQRLPIANSPGRSSRDIGNLKIDPSKLCLRNFARTGVLSIFGFPRFARFDGSLASWHAPVLRVYLPRT